MRSSAPALAFVWLKMVNGYVLFNGDWTISSNSAWSKKKLKMSRDSRQCCPLLLASVDCRLSAVGCRPPAAGCRPPAVFVVFVVFIVLVVFVVFVVIVAFVVIVVIVAFVAFDVF